MITTLPSSPVPVSAPQPQHPLQQLQARIESTLEGLKHTRQNFVSSMEHHLSELQTLRDTLRLVSQSPESPITARLPGIPMKKDTAPLAASARGMELPMSLADLPPLPEMPLSGPSTHRTPLSGTSPFSTLQPAGSLPEPRSFPQPAAHTPEQQSPFGRLPQPERSQMLTPPPGLVEAVLPAAPGASPFARLAEQELPHYPAAARQQPTVSSPFLTAAPAEAPALPFAQPATAPSPFAATLATPTAASPFVPAASGAAEPASFLPASLPKGLENLQAEPGKQPILWGALAAAPAAHAPAAQAPAPMPVPPQPTAFLAAEPRSASPAVSPFAPALPAASPFGKEPAGFGSQPSPFAAPAASPFAAPAAPAASPFSSGGYSAPAPLPSHQQPMPELENATMDELNAALAKAFSQVSARPVTA